jgi:hypothetical protein
MPSVAIALPTIHEEDTYFTAFAPIKTMNMNGVYSPMNINKNGVYSPMIAKIPFRLELKH